MPASTVQEILAAYRRNEGRLTFVWEGKEFYLGHTLHDRLSDEEQSSSLALLKRLPQLTQKNNDQPPPPCFSNRNFQRKMPTNQLGRNTCVCFALLAAMEGRLMRQGLADDLSEQFANWVVMTSQNRDWCDAGVRLKIGADALSKQGVCAEADCPYTAKIVKANCKLGPPQSARDARSVRIAQSILIAERGATTDNTVADLDLLKKILSNGYDIAIVVGMAFGKMTNPRFHDVIMMPDGPYQPPAGEGHALLMVGYCMIDGVLCFECKDSSNAPSHWRDGGYMWLSADFIREYARYGVVVTAVQRDGTDFGQILVPLPL